MFKFTKEEKESARKNAHENADIVNFEDCEIKGSIECLYPEKIKRDLKEHISKMDVEWIKGLINIYKGTWLLEDLNYNFWKEDSKVESLFNRFYPLLIVDENSGYDEGESGIVKINVSNNTAQAFIETIRGLNINDSNIKKTFVIAICKGKDCEAFQAKLDIYRSTSECKLVFVKI